MIHHQGTKVLETPRLILRPFTLADAPDTFTHWTGDKEVTFYQSWGPHTTVEQTKQLISQWLEQYSNPDFYNWALELKETGQVIGTTNVRPSLYSWEMGAYLGKPWWGKGLGPEAMEAMFAFLFKECNFHKIFAVHSVDNKKSSRSLEKSGLTKEAHLRSHYLLRDGTYADQYIWSLLQEDYFLLSDTP